MREHLASKTMNDERPTMNQKAAGFSGGLFSQHPATISGGNILGGNGVVQVVDDGDGLAAAPAG